jgi:hypothetical protein
MLSNRVTFSITPGMDWTRDLRGDRQLILSTAPLSCHINITIFEKYSHKKLCYCHSIGESAFFCLILLPVIIENSISQNIMVCISNLSLYVLSMYNWWWIPCGWAGMCLQWIGGKTYVLLAPVHRHVIVIVRWDYIQKVGDSDMYC